MRSKFRQSLIELISTVRHQWALRKRAAFLETSPKRFLFLEFGGIGDALMFTPAMAAVKRRWPDAIIDLVVASQRGTGPLLKDSGLVNHVIEYDIDAYGRSSLRATLELLWTIRRGKYDVYVSRGLGWRNLLRALLSGVPLRSGYYWPESRRKWGYHLIYDFVTLRQPETHDVTTCFEIVKPLGVIDWFEPYVLHVGEEAIRNARLLLDKARKFRRLIGLHMGCMRSKWQARWPAERYALLAKRLIEEMDAALIVVGGAEDVELVQPFWIALAADAFRQRVFDFTNTLDLKTTAAVVAACDLFISNDSGLAHIAAAVGVPQVVIWGPTHLRTRPWRIDDKSILIKGDLPCMPCWNGMNVVCTNPYRFQCMFDITVEKVLQGVRALCEPM
ncbi:glycosyltransferase family 9 protein [Candidatus Poribacteria bacterium]|nr:glycosyltransferase family 9 protein [Candidatus Poribacteria bacterium]